MTGAQVMYSICQGEYAVIAVIVAFVSSFAAVTNVGT